MARLGVISQGTIFEVGSKGNKTKPTMCLGSRSNLEKNMNWVAWWRTVTPKKHGPFWSSKNKHTGVHYSSRPAHIKVGFAWTRTQRQFQRQIATWRFSPCFFPIPNCLRFSKQNTYKLDPIGRFSPLGHPRILPRVPAVGPGSRRQPKRCPVCRAHYAAHSTPERMSG